MLVIFSRCNLLHYSAYLEWCINFNGEKNPNKTNQNKQNKNKNTHPKTTTDKHKIHHKELCARKHYLGLLLISLSDVASMFIIQSEGR